MSEIFRRARPDEVLEIARLQTHSFPAPGKGTSSQEKFLTEGPHGGIESLWIGVEDERVVAVCQLFSFSQWIGGVPLPVMGLGSVAIAPTHRRRGLAGRLLESAFAHSRQRGDLASALYPFRIDYYQRMGYGLAGEAHQYMIPPNALPDAPDERARVQMAMTGADEEAMRALYDEGARRETGQIKRNERSWAAAWGGAGGAAVLYRGSSGRPEGYAIIRYRADLPIEERHLEVMERMWLTPAARSGIYAWLASLGDQWRTLLYRAHPDEGFAERLREPRLPPASAPGWNLWFPSATLLRGPMFRLLDVPEALRRRTLVSGPAMTLNLEVDDRQIPENGGAWRVQIADGKLLVEPATADPVDAVITLSVSTLSRIYIGALTPSRAVAAGLAAIDRPDVLATLDHAFRVPAPWTFDRF